MLEVYTKINNISSELLTKSLMADNEKDRYLYLVLSGYLILTIRTVKNLSKHDIKDLKKQAVDLAKLMNE